MTDQRPTPEQIREQIEDHHDGGFTSSPSLREYDEALAEHGYVIVHPDDVPHAPPTPSLTGHLASEQHGWSDCRRHIFGDDA